MQTFDKEYKLMAVKRVKESRQAELRRQAKSAFIA